MVERIFRVMSNSGEHLTAEAIAMALLKQITLSSDGRKETFAVKEIAGENNLPNNCQKTCCS
ncbi:MAG: hypothetical protein WCI77_07830 [Candidatus Omnitrophota bacterium]